MEKDKAQLDTMYCIPYPVMEMIQNYRRIQGTDGNWNTDDYMRGLFNGIEICIALLEDREPQFRTAEEASATTLRMEPEQAPIFEYDPAQITIGEYLTNIKGHQEE